MDPEKKSLNFIFPTKYVIPKSLKFSHWLSEITIGSGPTLQQLQSIFLAFRLSQESIVEISLA